MLVAGVCPCLHGVVRQPSWAPGPAKLSSKLQLKKPKTNEMRIFQINNIMATIPATKSILLNE